MTPEELRMIERIIIALCGGMSIWLGYRLFISVPFAKTGNGKFEFPKLGKIVLSHVGPGIFFALFGAAVLLTGLFQSTKYQEHSIWDAMLGASNDANRKKVLSDLDELKAFAAAHADVKDAKRFEQIIANVRGYLSKSEIYIKREAFGPDPRLPGT